MTRDDIHSRNRWARVHRYIVAFADQGVEAFDVYGD